MLRDNPGLEEIELSNYGEIFLNPELPGILECAHRRGVAVTAGNGANLNTASGAALEALVKYRMRRIVCSIDGATQETYAKYRIGGNLQAVLENIEKINALKLQQSTPYPRLAWQFILFSHNRHEVEAARAMAKRLGMDFTPKLSWNEGDRRAYRERYGVEFTRGICQQLWTGPQFNWDGRVLGCSRNFWGEFGGNVFADGVLAAANGEGIEYARGMLLGRNPPREGIPCSTCEQYLSLRESGRWLTRSEVRVPRRLQQWAHERGLGGPAVFFALAVLEWTRDKLRRLRDGYFGHHSLL